MYTVYVCCRLTRESILCILQACVFTQRLHPTEQRSMSGTGNDEPRAKRRRCAPKRYAEEDDGSPVSSEATKLSSESSHEQKPSQQQRQQQAASHPARLSRPCGSRIQVQPTGSEDEQALCAIQHLAVKLAKQGRPYLGDLFCQTNQDSLRRTTTNRPNQSLLMTKDVAEAAALLVSFGC